MDVCSGRFGQPGAPRRRDGGRRDVDEDLWMGGAGFALGVHVGLDRRHVALAAVAGRAGGDDVLPRGLAALRAWDDVVDGEAGARAAVLAGPAVAGEDGAAGDLAA